jgi:hypothetical protein
MKLMTLRLDKETKKMLDDYCHDNSIGISNSIRQFIRDGIERYNKNKKIGFVDNIGSAGLMVNEKRVMKAVIETVYLVRGLVKDKALLDEASKKSTDILKDGWIYDNN